jgi:hypothetical protein
MALVKILMIHEVVSIYDVEYFLHQMRQRKLALDVVISGLKH